MHQQPLRRSLGACCEGVMHWNAWHYAGYCCTFLCFTPAGNQRASAGLASLVLSGSAGKVLAISAGRITLTQRR